MTLLRVGIVGVGVMGADHARRLGRTAGATLVAVTDFDAGRAAMLAASFDGVRAFADAAELIADPGVDAVIIASPGAAHEEQVLRCLEVGKPVLCEKPLTMDRESALRVVQAEQAEGRKLIQVGFMRRFDPEYTQLKAALSAGSLGRILLVHNVHRNMSTGPNFSSEMVVRDSLVHEVDVARFLFGEEIVRVQVLSPAPTSRAPEGVHDPQLAIFTMAGGGLVSTEVFVNTGVGYEVRCEVVGELGSAIIGRPGSGMYSALAPELGGGQGRWGGTIPADFRERFARAYDLEVQAWVDAARVGTQVGPDVWDGYAAVAVCEAGIASLATGQPVDVELASVDKGCR